MRKSGKITGRSGMIRSGVVYPLPHLAERQNGRNAGLWPTPCASDGRRIGGLSGALYTLLVRHSLTLPDALVLAGVPVAKFQTVYRIFMRYPEHWHEVH